MKPQYIHLRSVKRAIRSRAGIAASTIYSVELHGELSTAHFAPYADEKIEYARRGTRIGVPGMWDTCHRQCEQR